MWKDTLLATISLLCGLLSLCSAILQRPICVWSPDRSKCSILLRYIHFILIACFFIIGGLYALLWVR